MKRLAANFASAFRGKAKGFVSGATSHLASAFGATSHLASAFGATSHLASAFGATSHLASAFGATSIAAAIFLLALPACALLGPDDAQPVAKTAAARPMPPPRPKPKHEFGSLWSEDSVWNDVYSSSAARSVGDIVIVKIDETVKNQILQRYDQLVPPTDDEPKDDSDDNSDPAAKAKALQAAQKKVKDLSSQKIVRTTIQEVRPRGMYRIAGTEVVRFGPRQPRVTIEAIVRDRDIDSGDSVASDLLLSPKFDVQAAKSAAKVSDAADSSAPPTGG